MIILYFTELIFLALETTYKSLKTLSTPADKLPPQASYGAALVGLLIGLLCIVAFSAFIIYGLMEERSLH